jgi:hypothetical protein
MNYLLPLSIIGLGVLLLLGNLDIFHIRDIWHLLSVWWPILIILWGLHMLSNDMGRRKAARHDDHQPPSAGS